jgi:hypothetical protein
MTPGTARTLSDESANTATFASDQAATRRLKTKVNEENWSSTNSFLADGDSFGISNTGDSY